MTDVPQWAVERADDLFDALLERVTETSEGAGLQADARDIIARALAEAATPRAEDYEAAVEKAAKAIYDATDPTSDDPIATTLHESQFVHGDTVAQQLEMVMEICRAAARASLAVVGIKAPEVG